MPQQLNRLAIVFLVLIGGLIGARHYLVPKTFGALGHYRAAAIDAISSKPLVYAGHEVCATCHPDIAKMHDGARHRTVACEVCHGAQAAHVESPADHLPPAPRQRSRNHPPSPPQRAPGLTGSKSLTPPQLAADIPHHRLRW